MLIDCGGNVWVGGFLDCNADRGQFDRVIHIYRQGDLDRERACFCCLSQAGASPLSNDQNLVIRWREGERLDQMSIPVARVVEFAGQPGRLLVHCSAGHCRSAHLAVLAGMTRGLDPFAMIDRLNRQMFINSQIVPGWYWEVLSSILNIKLKVHPMNPTIVEQNTSGLTHNLQTGEAVGDPHISRFDGFKFDFAGLPNHTYNFLTLGDFSVHLSISGSGQVFHRAEIDGMKTKLIFDEKGVKRVESGSWRIDVHQLTLDDPNGESHLNIHILEQPADLTGASGLWINGTEAADPAEFEVRAH